MFSGADADPGKGHPPSPKKLLHVRGDGCFAASLLPHGSLLLLYPNRNPLGRAYAMYHRRHRVGIHLFRRSDIVALLDPWFAAPDAWRFCGVSSVCRARVRQHRGIDIPSRIRSSAHLRPVLGRESST